MTIVKDEDIRFGKPVVKGTRVTVEDIAGSFYEAGRSVEEVAEDYGIEEEEVEESLRYHNRELSSEEVKA